MGAENSSLQMSDVTIGDSVPLKSLSSASPSSGKVSSLSSSSSSSSSASCSPPWTLHRGEDVHSKTVSLFVYPKPDDNSRRNGGGNGAGALDGLPAAFKHAKVLRHPSLVKFQGIFTASDGRLVLVTEPVSPLLTIIESMTVEEITAGIYSILSSLVFLHDRVGVCHNNVALSSIFVTSDDGAWKLGALDHLKTYAEATWDWLRASRPRRDVAAITPEEKQKGPVGGGVEASAAQARDAYAFGQFTLALLNYIEEENEGLEMLKGIEEFKALISAQFLHTDPKKRSRLSSFLNHVFFKNNNYCDIINFLDTLPLKTSEEKEAFFLSLAGRLSSLSPSLVAFRLVRPLLRRFVLVEPSARIHFVPHLLTPKAKDGDASPSSQLSRESSPSTSPQHSTSSSSSSTLSPYGVLSEDLFAETVIPHLCKIVLVRDHDIFLTLLRFLPQYLHLIPKDKLEETFLPQMLLGLQDASDDIVAASLGGLASLVPLLGGDAVIGRGQDSQQTPRTKIFAYGAPRGFHEKTPLKPSSSSSSPLIVSPLKRIATSHSKANKLNSLSDSRLNTNEMAAAATTTTKATNSATTINDDDEDDAEERRRKAKERRDKNREQKMKERRKKNEQTRIEKKATSPVKISLKERKREEEEEEEEDERHDDETSRRSSSASALSKAGSSGINSNVRMELEESSTPVSPPLGRRHQFEKQRFDVSECPPPRPLAHVAPYVKERTTSTSDRSSQIASIPTAAATPIVVSASTNEEGASGGDWPDWSNDDTDDDAGLRSIVAASEGVLTGAEAQRSVVESSRVGGVGVDSAAPSFSDASRDDAIEDTHDFGGDQWGDDWGNDGDNADDFNVGLDDDEWGIGNGGDNWGIDRDVDVQERRESLPSTSMASATKNIQSSPFNVAKSTPSASPYLQNATTAAYTTAVKPLKLSSSPSAAKGSASTVKASPSGASAASTSTTGASTSTKANANKDLGSEFDVKAIRVRKKEEKSAEEVDFFADMMPDFGDGGRGGGGGGLKKNKKTKENSMKEPEASSFSSSSPSSSTTMTSSAAPDARFGVMIVSEERGSGSQLGVVGDEGETTGWQDADDDLGDNWDDF